MKFILHRASTSCSDDSPIPSDPRVKKESLRFVYSRDWSNLSQSEFEVEVGCFYAEGESHVIKGRIFTKLSYSNQWVIELNTLASLLYLIQREGEILVGTESFYDGVDFFITIYDARVE